MSTETVSSNQHHSAQLLVGKLQKRCASLSCFFSSFVLQVQGKPKYGEKKRYLSIGCVRTKETRKCVLAAAMPHSAAKRKEKKSLCVCALGSQNNKNNANKQRSKGTNDHLVHIDMKEREREKKKTAFSNTISFKMVYYICNERKTASF